MSVRSDLSSDTTALYAPRLLLVSAALTAGFVLSSEYRVTWAQVPLGIFVLFFAPGFALAAFILGKRAFPSYPANLAVIVGLSVVFNVVFGTVLLYFSIGPVDAIGGAVAALLCFAASVAQSAHQPARRSRPIARRLWSSLGFAGFSVGQRAAAYALLAGVLVTFGAIGYIATLQPAAAPNLALVVVGPDGTTSTLPLGGAVNSTMAVIVEVRNNATAQTLTLSVNASLIGQNGTNYTSIPWAMPLLLGPLTASSEPLSLSKGVSESVDVSFQFEAAGDYVVGFSLTSPGATAPVRSTTLSIEVT